MGDQAEQDRGLEMFRVGLEDLAIELFRLKQVARLVILLGDVQCLEKRVHDQLILWPGPGTVNLVWQRLESPPAAGVVAARSGAGTQEIRTIKLPDDSLIILVFGTKLSIVIGSRYDTLFHVWLPSDGTLSAILPS